MIEVCLYKSYFLWDNKIHSLIDSGPIGLSLMVVLAESYLQKIENCALDIASNLDIAVTPITHKRYVDDTHDRFMSKIESEKFLEILNNQDDRIQFEPEYEDEKKCLNFLDVKIENTEKGHYEFNIHRKSAITNVQLKPTSCHDDQIKYGVFKGFLYRAKSICSTNYIDQEIKFLISVFEENGYSRKILCDIAYNPHTKPRNNPDAKFVSLPMVPNLSQKLKKVFSKINYKVSFKSPRNLNSILTSGNKDSLPKNSYPGVYKIPCGCSVKYIGQTGAKVCKRCVQHEKACFNGKYNESAISEHNKDCNYDVMWNDATTIAVEANFYRRSIIESLEIKKEQINSGSDKVINKDDGLFVKTNTWNPLLRKINNFAHNNK